jgi:hypothetical protein
MEASTACQHTLITPSHVLRGCCLVLVSLLVVAACNQQCAANRRQHVKMDSGELHKGA